MKERTKMVSVDYSLMRDTFRKILLNEGLSGGKADMCAAVLADNTLDGVESHGVNRFGLFVSRLRSGLMDKDAEPVRTASFAALEQWDGNGGIGPVNGLMMMDRAMELADEHGVGLVALRNTTHWMRGATYAYHAMSRGYTCACASNTPPNMMPWGTKTEAIGNNPVVFGIPGKEAAVALDMALTQYSYGKLETLAALGDTLPFDGGFDTEDNLTKDPSALLQSRRLLPIGLWKGSGLSVIVDLFVSALAHGPSALDIDKDGPRVCQFFLAVHPGHSEEERAWRAAHVEQVIAELRTKCPEAKYPGEGTARRRAENLRAGILVNETVWSEVLKMLELS